VPLLFDIYNSNVGIKLQKKLSQEKKRDETLKEKDFKFGRPTCTQLCFYDAPSCYF